MRPKGSGTWQDKKLQKHVTFPFLYKIQFSCLAVVRRRSFGFSHIYWVIHLLLMAIFTSFQQQFFVTSTFQNENKNLGFGWNFYSISTSLCWVYRTVNSRLRNSRTVNSSLRNSRNINNSPWVYSWFLGHTVDLTCSISTKQTVWIISNGIRLLHLLSLNNSVTFHFNWNKIQSAALIYKLLHELTLI